MTESGLFGGRSLRREAEAAGGSISVSWLRISGPAVRSSTRMNVASEELVDSEEPNSVEEDDELVEVDDDVEEERDETGTLIFLVKLYCMDFVPEKNLSHGIFEIS